MISFSHVTKTFGSKIILKDASFTLEEGVCTALIGASGSGKTTIARVLLGLDTRFTGSITGVPRKKGCVFQEDRLLPQLTAEQNIRFAVPNASAKAISSAMNYLGLSGEEHSLPEKLSGGMKRRVALIRAVMADAPFILLDEPLKGLDESTAETAIQYIRNSCSGKTVLYLLHDTDEALMVRADHILRLSEGVITEEKAPAPEI